MRELLQFLVKTIGWFIRWGVVVWFLVLPCLILSGIFKPWAEAREALRAEGVNGLPLLIGGGFSSHTDAYGIRMESQQGSYIVVPDSFRRMEIFTYTVTVTNGNAPEARFEQSRILAVLLVLYIGAGVHTFFVFRRVARRRRMRLIQEG